MLRNLLASIALVSLSASAFSAKANQLNGIVDGIYYGDTDKSNSYPEFAISVENGKVIEDYSEDSFGCISARGGCNYEELIKNNNYSLIDPMTILRVTPDRTKALLIWTKDNEK